MVYCSAHISESWEDIRVKPRCCGLYILVQVKEAYHRECVWLKRCHYVISSFGLLLGMRNIWDVTEPKLLHEAVQHKCSVTLLKAGKSGKPIGLLVCRGGELRGQKHVGKPSTLLLQWEFFSASGTPYGSCMPQEMCPACLLRDHITGFIDQLTYFL